MCCRCALGWIQSLTGNTKRWPVGGATQDPLGQRALVVPDKAERVFNFQKNTLHALSEMIAAAGLGHPSQLGPHHLVRRVSPTEIRLFSQLHTFRVPVSCFMTALAGIFTAPHGCSHVPQVSKCNRRLVPVGRNSAGCTAGIRSPRTEEH